MDKCVDNVFGCLSICEQLLINTMFYFNLIIKLLFFFKSFSDYFRRFTRNICLILTQYLFNLSLFLFLYINSNVTLCREISLKFYI